MNFIRSGLIVISVPISPLGSHQICATSSNFLISVVSVFVNWFMLYFPFSKGTTHELDFLALYVVDKSALSQTIRQWNALLAVPVIDAFLQGVPQKVGSNKIVFQLETQPADQLKHPAQFLGRY